MTEAISDFCAKTGQTVPKTAADYVRVIYRSLAKRYKEFGYVFRRVGKFFAAAFEKP